MRRVHLRSRQRTSGQALVLVALTLSVLIALVIGVNDIMLRRRALARVQDSLDQAAALAVTQLEPRSLVANTPALLPRLVEEQFRARLKAELGRVAPPVRPDPATLAREARVQLIAPGGSCHGRAVAAPAVCAELTVSIVTVLGEHRGALTTLAQAARRP
jgi:hypothetical protein